MQGLIPMSHETAFSTPFSLHQFVALPFGLFRAPVMFQWLVQNPPMCCLCHLWWHVTWWHVSGTSKCCWRLVWCLCCCCSVHTIYIVNSEWVRAGIISDTATHIHSLTHQLAGFGVAAQWAPGLGISVCGSVSSGSAALSIPACSTSASEAWEEWPAVYQGCTSPGTVYCDSIIKSTQRVICIMTQNRLHCI